MTSDADPPPPRSGSTIVVLSGFAIRAMAQSILVLLLARSLDADGYGSLGAALAIAAILAPLAGLGFNMVVLREASYGSGDRRLLLTRACALNLATSLVLLPTFLLATMAAGVAIRLDGLLLLGISELLLIPMVDALLRLEQGLEHSARFVLISLCAPTMRLLSYGLLLWAAEPTPEVASYSFLAGAIAALAIAAIISSAKPRFVGMDREVRWKHAALGVPFSISGIAGRFQSEVDKPLVNAMLGQALAGVYLLAIRLAEVTRIPAVAIVEARFARLARAGASRGRDAWRAWGTGAAIGVLAMAITAAGLVAILPWLMEFLGPAYLQAAELLPLALVLAAVQTIRQAGRPLQIAATAVRSVARIDVFTMVTMLAACFVGIKVAGTRGALYAAIGTEVLAVMLMAGTWLALQRIENKSR